jgi:hypothetical protein
MKLDELYPIAQGLIETYAPRNTLFQKIDEMWNCEWTMTQGMPEWVLKSVSTSPHDAVLTTVRTFATVLPTWKIKPLRNREADRKRANEIETALAYNFYQAGRRRDTSVVWDVMFSATMYGEVAAQVVYLPYQEKVLKAMGKDAGRLKALKRFGDWAFIIHHPGNIFTQWSEYGIEKVLNVKVQTVDEFINSWGKNAEKIVDRKAYLDGKINFITSYDLYNGYDKRCVWGVASSAISNISSAGTMLEYVGEMLTDDSTASFTSPKFRGGGIKILEEENDLGFIPYAIRRWGNSLTSDTDKRVMPLLQSVYASGQWDMLNVLESLDVSLALKRAAQVQFAGEFPPGQTPEIDNTEPAGVLELPQGTRNFTPLPNQSVDQRLENSKIQYEGKIWQASIAKFLQSMQLPGGTSYSLGNQMFTTATNSISNWKLLAQNALSELSHLMLCWISYYGDKYGAVDLEGQYFEKKDKLRLGQEIRISSDTIDPDVLQVEVELTADHPVDKLQETNAAILIKNNFRVSEEKLLDDLGYPNPQEEADKRNLEDYKNAYVANDIRQIQMQTDLQFQAQQMEMQMGMQQQAMQQQGAMQQEQAAREQEAAMANASQNASPAMENMEGMNPAAGGMPPVEMARGQK